MSRDFLCFAKQWRGRFRAVWFVLFTLFAIKFEHFIQI